MIAYWEFLLSALQGVLGKELGQLAAWTFCIVVILCVVVPLYMMMKASTQVRTRREDEMAAISGVDTTANPKPRFGLGLSLNPSINIRRAVSVGPSATVKVTTSQPLVVKLDKDAVQRARDLLTAGGDLDSVCREIEPEYANWISLQQRAFRKALETVLGVEQGAGTSTQVTIKRL